MATIMEVTLQCRWLNQTTINVFNFLWDGIGASPGTLSAALMFQLGWSAWNNDDLEYPAGSFAASLQNLTSTGLQFELVTVKDVYSETDFYEWLFPFVGGSAAGQQGTATAAPFLSFGFRSSKTKTTIKRGAKRFPGVVSGQLGAGGTWIPDTLADMAQLAAAMSAILTGPAETNFFSTICKKERVPVMSGGEPTGTFKYQYFADPLVQIANSAFPVVWDNITTQRSQTSRQFGRGR